MEPACWTQRLMSPALDQFHPKVYTTNLGDMTDFQVLHLLALNKELKFL